MSAPAAVPFTVLADVLSGEIRLKDAEQTIGETV